MKRTGKTIVMYQGLISSILSGLESFLVGDKIDIKHIKDYFHEFYGINTMCEPIYKSHYFPQREMYTEDGLIKQITKYEPIIMGYKIFKV